MFQRTPLTSTLSTPAYDAYYTAARNCAPTQGRRPKSPERGENWADNSSYILGNSLGEGVMRSLGGGTCPRPGTLTPPPPLHVDITRLEKLFSADPTLHHHDSERPLVCSGSRRLCSDSSPYNPPIRDAANLGGILGKEGRRAQTWRRQEWGQRGKYEP